MMQFVYFTTDYAVKTHDRIIEISGGANGILNIGILDSVLEHIQNDLYYCEIEDKLTHLVYSVNKGHAFQDGNKRSSIALGAFFLELNGLDSMVSKFIVEMENIAVHIADNRINKELLSEIIQSLIYEDEYSEEIKLKIIHAITIEEH
jgi:death on curing protein